MVDNIFKKKIIPVRPVSINRDDLIVANHTGISDVHAVAGRCKHYGYDECIGAVRVWPDGIICSSKGFIPKRHQIFMDIQRLYLDILPDSPINRMVDNVCNDIYMDENCGRYHHRSFEEMRVPYSIISIGWTDTLHEAFQMIVEKMPLIQSNLLDSNLGPDIHRFWDGIPMKEKKRGLWDRYAEEAQFNDLPIIIRHSFSYEDILLKFEQHRDSFSDNVVCSHILELWLRDLGNQELGQPHTPRLPTDRSYSPIPRIT